MVKSGLRTRQRAGADSNNRRKCCHAAVDLNLPAARSEYASFRPVWGSPKASEEQANRPIRDKWAVVIGIDTFKDSSISYLQFPAKDAADFADFLIHKGNFAQDHVLLLTNEWATRDNIRDAIGGNWLPRRAKAWCAPPTLMRPVSPEPAKLLSAPVHQTRDRSSLSATKMVFLQSSSWTHLS